MPVALKRLLCFHELKDKVATNKNKSHFGHM